MRNVPNRSSPAYHGTKIGDSGYSSCRNQWIAGKHYRNDASQRYLMETRERLTEKRQSLEDKIREIKNRLPAHSIKPGMMMELMELEDERDRIQSRIERMESGE